MARKIAVAVIGGTVVVFGVALIVLPGPACLVIPLGLAILATEFAWARRLLHHVEERVARLLDRGKRTTVTRQLRGDPAPVPRP